MITCPDCHQQISSAATVCPHCGRPMSATAPAVQQGKAPLLTISNRPSEDDSHSVPLGRCPKCGSADLRRVSLVYEEGTNRIETTTDGGGIGYVGDQIAFGMTSSSTSGVAQSDLAEQLAPPERLEEGVTGGAFSFGCLSLLALTAFVLWSAMIYGRRGFAVGSVLWILGMAFWWWGIGSGRPLTSRENAKWNATVYPKLRAKWERSLICMRCGTITDPGNQAKEASSRLLEDRA